MKKIMIAFCLLIAASSHAQSDYAFRVLANKGANQVKSGDAWQPLKTGTQLQKNDELKVSANASVGLVSINGKPLEVKEAKTYKVIDLLAKVGTSSSVLNKYTDFILSSNSDEARKNRLTATGAVHRGMEDIKLFLPENQNAEVFNNVILFHWEATKGVAPFIVSLKDLYGTELLRIEVTESSAKIDLSDPKIAKEAAVLVDVKSKTDSKSSSEQRLIKKISPAKQEQIKKLLADVSSDLKEETAFNNYLLAAFYEENRLFIDAIACYEQALKMDPENPTYKDAYEEFLLRNKLKSVK